MTESTVYLLPGREGLRAWRQCLQTSLALAPAADLRLDLRLHDSFDGRLYRAGLLLVSELGQDDGKPLLLLRRRSDHARVASVRAPLSKASMADTLPAGALRKRLCKLLRLRALLPMAAMKARCIELVHRDAEGKIRTRLFLEDFRLQDRATERFRPLVRWLRMEALRGYEADAHTLRQSLERDFHLAPETADLALRMHRRLGTVPEEQAFRLPPDLHKHQRADAAVHVLLGHLLDVIEANEAGTRAGLDTEFLHDLRVAVRSQRALLGQLKSVFPPAIHARLSEDFAWLGSVTGPPRDLDVALLEFDGFIDLLAPPRRAHLEPLRDYLQKRREEEYDRLQKALGSRRYRELKRRLRTWLERPLPVRPRAADAIRPVDEVARQRTWRMYRRVLREGEAITPESPPEDLHELRKSCKKLRYLIQFFQPLYDDAGVKEAIRELKRLQDNLGEYQDLFVQCGMLSDLPDVMREQGTGDENTYAAMASLREKLEHRKVEVRNRFAARFRRFSREDNRRRYRALFRP